VPTTFKTYKDYKQVFEYLFHYEVFNRLLGRDDATFSHMSKSEFNEDSIGKKGAVLQYWVAKLT
jgi:hypothetical protein